MDAASTIHQYRFVLAFLGLGLVFGMISVAVPHFMTSPAGNDTYSALTTPQLAVARSGQSQRKTPVRQEYTTATARIATNATTSSSACHVCSERKTRATGRR